MLKTSSDEAEKTRLILRAELHIKDIFEWQKYYQMKEYYYHINNLFNLSCLINFCRYKINRKEKKILQNAFAACDEHYHYSNIPRILDNITEKYLEALNDVEYFFSNTLKEYGHDKCAEGGYYDSIDGTIYDIYTGRTIMELWRWQYNIEDEMINYEQLFEGDAIWRRLLPSITSGDDENHFFGFWYPPRFWWYYHGIYSKSREKLVKSKMLPSGYFERNHFTEVRERVMKK